MVDTAAVPDSVEVAASDSAGPDLSGPGTAEVMRPRLLLVEDDDGDAFLVRELLEQDSAGFDILRVRSVAEALPELSRGVACVLLDLGLPDAQGLQALHGVLSAAGQAAVLCLTGLADEHRGVQAVAAGAQDYLVKGQVDEQTLRRSIRYALERRRADEQARQLYASRARAAENSRLERGLLPQPQLRDPGLLVTTRYRPGRDALLGGDFYDVVETDDGAVHVVVGDVAGHGPDEAALGVCLRIAWRTLVLAGAAPPVLLSVMEDVLVRERRSEEVFTTLTMVVLDADRTRAEVWLAGHPAPVLLTNPPVPVYHSTAGPALGLLPKAAWQGAGVELGPRWRLLLYTDGIVEGRIGRGALRLGTDGLLDLIVGAGHATPTVRLLDGLLDRVQELNGGPLSDDVALVGLEWPG